MRHVLSVAPANRICLIHSSFVDKKDDDRICLEHRVHVKGLHLFHSSFCGDRLETTCLGCGAFCSAYTSLADLSVESEKTCLERRALVERIGLIRSSFCREREDMSH